MTVTYRACAGFLLSQILCGFCKSPSGDAETDVPRVYAYAL